MTIIKINDPYERGGFILPIEDDIPPEQLREITDFLDSDTRRVWAEDSTNRRHVTHSTDALTYEGMDYAAPDTPESILLREEERDEKDADDAEKLNMYLSTLTETQRRRIQMRMKGMSFKDIAETEGADSSSVRESVRSVWKKLHKKFPYVAAELGINQFDECSFKLNQMMYWPTTSADGEYICKVIDGEWLDPDAYLAAHPNWRDISALPVSERENRIHERNGKHQKDPLAKEGAVGAFCRTYTITDAIERFLPDVYEKSDVPNRYDYRKGEGKAGVVIYNDRFVYSHHATDPACGKLLNAFDLVRVHRFWDEDKKKSFQEMADFPCMLSYSSR